MKKNLKKLFVVGSLAEQPHDGCTKEQRYKVVEVKTCRIVVEHEEEHQWHEIHHPLHHLHLLCLLTYHLVALLTHGHPRVQQVGYTEQDTGQTQVVANQPDVGVPFDDWVEGA